jgi:hypothetical protein
MPSPVQPNYAQWEDVLNDTPSEWLTDVAPAADLITLVRLNALVHHAMSQPYPVSGLACNASYELSGTHTITLGLTQVTGSGTNYLTELSVGDPITIAGESRKVATITNDTTLTVSTAFTAASSGNWGSRGTWYWAQRLNAGAALLQGRVFIGLSANTNGATPSDISLMSSSSGIAANDRIPIEIDAEGFRVYPPGANAILELRSSENYAATPTEPTDRLYEVYIRSTGQATTPDTELPYTEGFSGVGMHGMTAKWTPVADMNSL